MPDAYPRLRPEIDAAPASRDGETYYILYDRASLVPSRLLVSPMGLLIAGRMDGSLSVLDIADLLAGEYGGVTSGEVETVVKALDDAFFLEGPRYRDYLAQAERDFRAAPVRAPASAGSAYSDDPETLAADLDAMLGAAPPPEEGEGARESFPRGVIVPHIDYLRGAPGYGQVYSYLKNRPAPETVVVIGTSHVPLSSRYSLCEKDFATPLGVMPADGELCGRVRETLSPYGGDGTDVLVHRGEHSIELQTVWLRRLYGDAVRIVPLLAGTLGDYLEGDREPAGVLGEPVFSKLAATLAEASGKGGVMLMAAADLSHVGPRFGDDRDLSDAYLAEVEDADRDYLDAVTRDPLAGLESLAAHGNRHHVCGAACVFALGLALFGARARLLGYHQAVTPEMGQAVTYAAMVMD